ncbi:MAG TPA: threonine/serine exporter family protein [Blastocatellia bacterium]|nr:threonine/serine exporter family protein [Blastocatellia bacterium]
MKPDQIESQSVNSTADSLPDSFDGDSSSSQTYCPPGGDSLAVAFAIKLFRALHEYGTPTYRLEQLMRQVSSRLGLRGEFFSLPTGIFLSFGAPEEQRTAIVRVEPSSVDLGKLASLQDLTGRIIRGEVTSNEASETVDRIISAPSGYGSVLTVLCYGLASGTGASLFGGGWREVLISTAIGIILGLLASVLGRSEDASRLFEPAAAILASSLAIVAARIMQPLSIYIATLAGLIVLFPGLTLTVAIRELATRNLVSGTAQLTSAAVVFLELAFGVALGSEINRVLPPVHVARNVVALPMWTQGVALLIAPLAFAVLLKARKHDLGWILLACMGGFAGARFGGLLLGPELGGFLGALVLGMGGNAYARLLDKTSAILLAPGMLILVPGTVGFSSLSKFLKSDAVSGVQTAFNMSVIAIALVTGLLVANVLIPQHEAAKRSGKNT